MLIAISGTHASGKSTLVAELSEALPAYEVVAEPYYLLEQEGHEFAELPSVDDFALQLERSIESLNGGGPDAIFERCPADFLGYLLVHDNAGAFDLADWLPRVRGAIKQLDLVVFVPVEARDRIILPRSDDARFRRRVDAKLREILLDNLWDFDVDVLEVTGTARERAGQVLAHLHDGGKEAPCRTM